MSLDTRQVSIYYLAIDSKDIEYRGLNHTQINQENLLTSSPSLMKAVIAA